MESEARRIQFVVERDGLEAACAWVKRTVEIYRRAIVSSNSHAYRADYRPSFEAAIKEFKEWLKNQCV
ncbi:MAG: hypothetical protein OES46_16610 [Gammaproteobacteria bacterium]|nr:hypothetical protein [Gammaproteobacteria bacterium]